MNQTLHTTRGDSVRVALLGDFGLTWPWESLHVEALAWFDHWLKGLDTGILDGPRIRYVLPGADGWQSTEQWPPIEAALTPWNLGADGVLAGKDDLAADTSGARSYLTLGAGMGAVGARHSDPPSSLQWSSEPLSADLDVTGAIELELRATATATDTAWIVTLSDEAPDGTITPVTAGFLRASLRTVDDAASRPGAPVLDCRTAVAVPPGDEVQYRIPLVPNARRFAVGHRIHLDVRSDDLRADATPIMGFSHATVGTSSVNSVSAASRLLLPVMPSGAGAS